MAAESKHADHDFSNDELPPEFIKQHLLAHDKRMREGREEWALAKACYTTNYWKHLRSRGHSNKYSKKTDIDIEVNRLWLRSILEPAVQLLVPLLLGVVMLRRLNLY